MKKLVALATFALVLGTGSAFAETLTGVVSDAMCARNPVKASSPAHAACAAKCIKMGSPAVLIVNDHVFQVSNPQKLASYAGKKVTVGGTVANNMLTVDWVK